MYQLWTTIRAKTAQITRASGEPARKQGGEPNAYPRPNKLYQPTQRRQY